MKKLFRFSFLLLLIPFFNSCFYCNDCNDEDTFVNPYTPVLLDRTLFENSVQSLPAQNIIKSGKIYLKDNLMFINEVNKGFHVYNYTNPENPVRIGFIQIIGATDLAVRNNIIYINQAVDLVTLEYNYLNNSIVVTHRNRNVFPQKTSPNGSIAYTGENQIVVDWIQN